MSITATAFTKTRAELATVFGWDAGSVTPEQMLRLDCAVALRLGLDELQGRLIRGESVDIAKMLTASEALSRLLPATVLAAPPAERRSDPRAALLELILQQRARAGIPDEGLDERDDEIAALKAENLQLRAVARAAGLPVAPPDVDITPPSELGDFRIGGPKPAPDDKPPPVTIDADAVDLRAGFNSGTPEPWRDYVQPDGSISPTRGKWWGPV